jgi:prepilin peptidase CpaA
MSPERLALVVAVGGFSMVAAVIDIRTRRLPNVMTVPACLLGLVYHLVAGYFRSGLEGLGAGALHSLGGFAVGFGLLFLMWLSGSGGGGDVKFMGALGAWLGAMATIYVFLVGAVYVLLGSLGSWGWRSLRPVDKQPRKPDGGAAAPSRQIMPWAVPLALAVWSVFIYEEVCGKQ